MGAVALFKTEGIWQPGLFQVRLRGIVTELFGLGGDSVFPTLLSNLFDSIRFDPIKKKCEIPTTLRHLLLALDVLLVNSHLVSKIQACLPALLCLVPSICSQQDWRWCRSMLYGSMVFLIRQKRIIGGGGTFVAVVQSFLLYIMYLITK